MLGLGFPEIFRIVMCNLVSTQSLRNENLRLQEVSRKEGTEILHSARRLLHKKNPRAWCEFLSYLYALATGMSAFCYIML